MPGDGHHGICDGIRTRLVKTFPQICGKVTAHRILVGRTCVGLVLSSHPTTQPHKWKRFSGNPGTSNRIANRLPESLDPEAAVVT